MKRATAAFLLVAASSAFLAAQSKSPPANRPPVIATTLQDGAIVLPYTALRFTVTITDPDGDRVFARVLSAPRELSMSPIVNAPSGVTRDVVWYPDTLNLGGRQELVLEAWDARHGSARARRSVRFSVGWPGRGEDRGPTALDLDGDPGLELLAVAADADVLGVIDAGAIARFDVAFSAPSGISITRDALVAKVPRSFGMRAAFQERFGDVTGDGRPEIVGIYDHANDSKVLCWDGSASGGNPNFNVATMRSSDRLSHVHAAAGGVILDDVTNDGIDDVVVAFPDADTTVVDAGEVRIFQGGAGMSGAVTPLATLQVPAAIAGDELGWRGEPDDLSDPVMIGDVTGDGIRDVVVAASHADVGSTVDAGSIYVWSGGAALSGKPAPLATLQTSGSLLSKSLTDCGGLEMGLHLVDVTGDGVLDVVAAAPLTSGGGAIFVWKGGPTLTGTLDAAADLVTSTRVAGDGLGQAGYAQAVQFADLNLDGTTDVIAAATFADVAGAKDAGAIYFFAGGALSGTVTETATLRLATPTKDDRLAYSNAGLQIADVTGDGAPDVVEGSYATDGGEIRVWAAQAGLAGAVFPSATLAVPSGQPHGVVTLTNPDDETFGIGLVLADVTGDGILDVLGVDALASSAAFFEQGAIDLWAGGAGLTTGGIVAPTAILLEPNAATTNYLGLRFWDQGPAVRTADFDGDGIRDVIACESLGSGFYGYYPGERVLVWRGGMGLAGTPPPDATAETGTSQDLFTHGGVALDLADVTGDGFLDLVGSAPAASNPAGTSFGALFVFAGGPTAIGNLPIRGRLEDATGAANGLTMEHEWGSFADVDGDGFLDVLVSSPSATITLSGQGAVLWFRGPMTTVPIEPHFFSMPGFGPDAGLGD